MLILALAAPAFARNVYVTNSISDDVSVIDTGTGKAVGEPIEVGDGPGGIAIAPNGTRVYVANFGSDSVSAIDAATNETVGEPIVVGDGPRGVAVAPNGKRVYVANELSGDVSVIDAATGEVLGEPIPVGTAPEGLAISPNGKRVYVANSVSDDVSTIDTATGETVGEPIEVGSAPLAVAVAPDGGRVYVTNRASESISVIGAASGSVVDTIQLKSFLIGIAIAPDGGRAYVAHYGPGTVSVIDTASDETVGEPIKVGELGFGIAIAPDGGRAYVVNEGSGTVSTIDTATDETVGAEIPVGSNPLGIAIVPDQPPRAALAPVPADGAPGQPVRFDASGSQDPDGQIARYDWDFGDGQTALDAGPTPTHTYGAPGDYRATVTLTDSEGCSTSFVFTGLTASCNGSALARVTQTLHIGAGKPPPKPHSNRFRIVGSRRNAHRGTVKLRVWVPGPGRLTVRGAKVGALNRTARHKGLLTLTLRPKRMAMKQLRRRGHLQVRAIITFSPDGGVPRTLSKGLTLLRRHG
ncbi:MAG TPA: PKD domain-containing protein [Solirubrobacterales bacterium]